VSERDPRHDFDFMHGRWVIKHRRLRERLVGCTEWDEFESTQTVRPMFGGAAQIDEIQWDDDGEIRYGCTVRLYDPVRDQWSMNWADSMTGRFFPPMIGNFRYGTGYFGGTDTVRGKIVLSRFVWSDITADSARWHQAFSENGGLTWEINWYMDSFRIAE